MWDGRNCAGKMLRTGERPHELKASYLEQVGAALAGPFAAEFHPARVHPPDFSTAPANWTGPLPTSDGDDG